MSLNYHGLKFQLNKLDIQAIKLIDRLTSWKPNQEKYAIELIINIQVFTESLIKPLLRNNTEYEADFTSI